MRIFFFIVLSLAASVIAQEYSTCETWDELVAGENFRYASVIRVSDPGTKERPVYTGFWFFDELQFDVTGRYALAMKVYFRGRDVTPADRGYIDLKDGNKWTKIGQTTAWNWQQGCRLQWRPNSEEILWNDRSDDGSHYVCRVYHFKTGMRRTLPRPIYDVSPDGKVALTHDFPRMKHAGTKYVGIPDPFENHIAPAQSGIEKMDMDTGQVEFLISLERMARIAFPDGYKGRTNLYIFREGWNPSGTRFIAFLRNLDFPLCHCSGWSISPDGRDVRYFFNQPSHHAWQDNTTMFEGRYFAHIKDDGSGKILPPLAIVKANIDPTLMPAPYDDWILGNTYAVKRRPAPLFVPPAHEALCSPGPIEIQCGGRREVSRGHSRTVQSGWEDSML